MPETQEGGTTTPPAVLVADDNEVAQRLCRRVLERAGYPVLIAGELRIASAALRIGIAPSTASAMWTACWPFA